MLDVTMRVVYNTSRALECDNFGRSERTGDFRPAMHNFLSSVTSELPQAASIWMIRDRRTQDKVISQLQRA